MIQVPHVAPTIVAEAGDIPPGVEKFLPSSRRKDLHPTGSIIFLLDHRVTAHSKGNM